MFRITCSPQDRWTAGPLTLSGTTGRAPAQPDITFLEDRRVHRKVTYKLYPIRSEEDGLWHRLRLHNHLSNAAIEERVSAWRLQRKTITFADQCKSLTEIRAADSDYAALNAQSQQVTLKRVDLAFKAFFRRVKEGQKPGFPRYKSLRRFSGWGYKTHGDGFEFRRGDKGDHGQVRIEDLGWIRCRGRARTPGEPVTAEILHKADGWYLSLTVKCEPHREVMPDRKPMSFDWGVETYMTLAEPDAEGLFYDGNHDGNVLAATVQHIANPRIMYKLRDRITALQQVLARKKRGSKGWKQVANDLARLRQYEARCRKDFIEKVTADLVARYHTIITETLTVSNMTRSARGTLEEPGRNVAQKAGLNTAILDTAPSFTLSRLRIKAEEAVCAWIELNTRVEAPSQHCPLCGSRRRKNLDDRIHQCLDCGHTEPRDDASARYMLARIFGFVQPKKTTRTKRVSKTQSSEKQTGEGLAGGHRARGLPREPKPETPLRTVQRFGGSSSFR